MRMASVKFLMALVKSTFASALTPASLNEIAPAGSKVAVGGNVGVEVGTGVARLLSANAPPPRISTTRITATATNNPCERRLAPDTALTVKALVGSPPGNRVA